MIKLVHYSKDKYLNYRWKFSILALIVMALSSCAPKPEETVEKYLNYTFLDNNGKKAYRLLSSDDKKYKTEQEFVSEIRRKNVFNEKILKKYKDEFSFDILETNYLNDDTILVKVALAKPNTQVILHEMITFAMTASFSRMTEEEKNSVMQEQFGKIIKDDEMEIETEEKEYMLIREEGEYKIYLNLGEPQKMRILSEKLNELDLKAEEQKRVIDYKNALTTYETMYSFQKDESILAEIEEIKKIQKNTVTLRDKLDIGNLTIKPKKIEVRKVKVSRKNWLDELPKNSISEDAYFVLTFEITNNCEGEVFEFYDESRYKKEHQVYDNYGNIMNEFDLDFDIMAVEDYKNKKLPAGETVEVKAVCEAPLSKKAEKFLWRIKLYTDNKKTENYAYVSFTKKEISYAP